MAWAIYKRHMPNDFELATAFGLKAGERIILYEKKIGLLYFDPFFFFLKEITLEEPKEV